MRITEHRMVELASQGLSNARERVTESSQELLSGLRVARPSQDPAAWAQGRRAEALQTMNSGRGEALARSQERLTQVDVSLGQIGDAMTRAQELAIEASSETIDPESLLAIAAEVRGLRLSALAAANTRSSEGEYVFAGSRSGAPPFDEDGVYQGDDEARVIETASGLEQEVTVTGSFLTISHGVNLFAALAEFEAALNSNDRVGITAAIESMRGGNQQVSSARSDGGAKSAALQAAQDAQIQLDTSLVALQSRLLGADPIAAATELAQHSQALAAAQSVAESIVEMTRP
jgi:flagellar hook-associated protein 3 FlgL